MQHRKKCEFWGLKRTLWNPTYFEHTVTNMNLRSPCSSTSCSTGSLPKSENSKDIPPVLKPRPCFSSLTQQKTCQLYRSWIQFCHPLTANTLVATTLTLWLDSCYSLLNGLFSHFCSPRGHSRHRRKSDAATSQIMSWLLSTSPISFPTTPLFLIQL